MQGDKSTAMFFIVFGDCIVQERDLKYNQSYKKKMLVKSDHFGEIGLLYNTKRTCSIVSSSYNILARLTKPRMRALVSDYPQLLENFLKHIY